MKILFLLALLFVSLYAKAQEPEIGVMPDAPKIECHFDKYLAAPYYFDKEMANIARGTINEIEYKSFTVGITRKATIYLPPNYSKKRSILFCIFCTELAATTKSGCSAYLI